MFAPGNLDECRIQIHPIDSESLRGQQPRVFASPARHVQNRPAPRIDRPQQADDLRRFGPVVLERPVNEIVVWADDVNIERSYG